MRNEKGMSLLELTLTIAVASVLIISITRAVRTQLEAAVDARDYTIALNLAKRQMAIINNGAYPAVGTTAPASDPAFPDFIFSQVVADVATSGANSLRSIQLSVLIGNRVLVRLFTYRSNIITFGTGS